MLKTTHATGIDPGLVHTGAVSMLFKPDQRKIIVDHLVVDGVEPASVEKLYDWTRLNNHAASNIWIEAYRPRGHLSGDKRMVEGVARIRATVGGKVLLNHGVKKVVTQDLMELLGVWKFTTVTHHQDLRAAARILLFGMLKDAEMNALITRVVMDHLTGQPWTVIT